MESAAKYLHNLNWIDINYIEFLLSEKVDPYKFGANIWDIEDQTNQSYWVKEKNKL